jgi:hypothetical protein
VKEARNQVFFPLMEQQSDEGLHKSGERRKTAARIKFHQPAIVGRKINGS